MSTNAYELLHYETLDSTNEEAKRLLADGKIKTLTAILAGAQTAGKGTQGRQWASPPGAGLYVSIVHPFPENPSRHVPLTPIFTLAAGIACAETLGDNFQISVQLKPINDLYVANKKLGGILTESIIHEGRFKALITGIGLNLLPAERMFEGANQRGIEPICLQDCLPPESMEAVCVKTLAGDLTRSVDFWYQHALSGDHTYLLNQYMKCKLPGIELPVELLP